MNAILIVIDALNYTRCQNSKIELLPNITKRAKNGLICENIFSQAPFTEAATLSLYCGQNVLDNHGYIEKYNFAKKTLFEVLSEAGYETFFSDFQPECFSSSVRRGIDNLFYSRGFANHILWVYRFDYFSKKWHDKIPNKIDILQMIRLMDDHFVEWKQFLNALIENDKSVYFIKLLNENYDAKGILDQVIEQETLYKRNKEAFIFDVLKKNKEHPVFSIPMFRQIDYHYLDSISDIYDNDMAHLCKNIRQKNLLRNILFNEDCFSSAFRVLKEKYTQKEENVIHGRKFLLKNALFLYGIDQKYGLKCHSLKGQPSFNAHIDHLLKWIDEREEKDHPFFACIHVDDLHFPEMFFSYDTNNVDILREEINVANDYLKKYLKNRKGTITCDLSLLYADAKCECLIREIEKRNLLEDTSIFITADHGFSYGGYPIREKAINTYYLENYKIPFFAFGKEIENKKIYDFKSILDVPATICEIMNIPIPKEFAGCSVYSSIENRILTIEYCGEGCPDINDKKLMIAAFDKDYLVAANIALCEEFNYDKIIEIYDLNRDPLQRKNLRENIDKNLIIPYLLHIKKRFDEIKESNRNCINKIVDEKETILC